jgi:hypothetical protein
MARGGAVADGRNVPYSVRFFHEPALGGTTWKKRTRPTRIPRCQMFVNRYAAAE